jgi:hypothetical protein
MVDPVASFDNDPEVCSNFLSLFLLAFILLHFSWELKDQVLIPVFFSQLHLSQPHGWLLGVFVEEF